MTWIILVIAVILALAGGLLDTFLTLHEVKIAVFEHIREAERIAETLEPIGRTDLRCSINSLKKAI